MFDFLFIDKLSTYLTVLELMNTSIILLLWEEEM